MVLSPPDRARHQVTRRFSSRHLAMFPAGPQARPQLRRSQLEIQVTATRVRRDREQPNRSVPASTNGRGSLQANRKNQVCSRLYQGHRQVVEETCPQPDSQPGCASRSRVTAGQVLRRCSLSNHSIVDSYNSSRCRVSDHRDVVDAIVVCRGARNFAGATWAANSVLHNGWHYALLLHST